MRTLELFVKVGKVYQKLQQTTKKIVISRGGTSSGKTYSKCQIAAGWLWNGLIREIYEPEGVFSIGRQFSATLEGSVMRDFYNVLEEAELRWSDTGEFECFLIDMITINKSKKTFSRESRVVEFIGCDDYHKAKGARRKFLWLNEADEILFSVFLQLVLRTEHICFIDFNPDDEDIWINQELELARAARKGDVDVIVSTYKDNPFLTKAQTEEIEDLKVRDPMMWQIFGMGEYGKIRGRIFDFEDIDRVPEGAELLGYGLDFGFSNDPSSCVGLYRVENDIIFDEVFYKKGMFNEDIANALQAGEVKCNEDIAGDSADPKSIAELSYLGFRIFPVKKGPDSIVYGISCMKQFNIKITKRSLNLRKEMKKYKWAEDKNEKTLNKPLGGFDHAIDAARYICMEKLPFVKKVSSYREKKESAIIKRSSPRQIDPYEGRRTGRVRTNDFFSPH